MNNQLSFNYNKILVDYLGTHQEACLYQVAEFAKELMKQEMSPEVTVGMHLQAVKKINKGKKIYPRKFIDKSFTFLMEGIRAYGIAYKEYYQDLRKSYLSTIRALVSVLEVKNLYIKGHSDAVASYALAIAKMLDISPQEIEAIEVAAMLHDIGKIGIHEDILSKSGKLDEEDWKEMKRHPEICLEILNGINFPWDIKPIIHAHHERYDGKGYPFGLKEKEIPLGARIIAVADSYDAMTSDRAYRKGLSKKAAIKELKRVAGTQLDPEIVKVFIEIPITGKGKTC